VIIPRIGMEVLVEFLEGDPDKPVVVGNVFNGKNDAPYPLPAHKTKAVWRSNTHKGQGFNEIAFEDEKGQEEVFLHAQRYMTTKVINNQSQNILANRIESVGASASLMIGKNQIERIGANKSVTVGGGGGALGLLTSLVSAGGSFFSKAAKSVGAAAPVSEYADQVAGVGALAGDIESLISATGFAVTGEHRTKGGSVQAEAAGGLSGILTRIFPGSGTLSTVIEKFRSDTVGLASTEQVGVAKNVVVGQVNSLSVGKRMNVLIGEDYDFESRKSIFARTTTHTLHAKEKFIIAGPGGSISIDEAGITIRARKFEVHSPEIDFKSGAPDQVAALRSDKPFVEECPLKSPSKE
ncbi:type VI secretion system tip protein VgrG, partial [Paracoccus sp. 11-3]|nr:type VI secretion system tip protein VgrG [Paracoccus amoyensis]